MTTLLTVGYFLSTLIVVSLPCFLLVFLLATWEYSRGHGSDSATSLVIYAGVTSVVITCLLYLAGWGWAP